MKFTTIGNTSITGTTSSKVTLANAITLQRNNKVVASIDAEYDFKTIPVEYHRTMLQMLLSNRKTIQLAI